MSDYNLHGLNPRDFQHLVQAIARKQIASGVTAFGDGPDGCRDLAFRGQMDFPSVSGGWNGYLVMGCKFKKGAGQTTKDGEWAVKQLNSDLKKFKNKKRKLPIPEYYLFATNVSLTAAQDAGSRDRVAAQLLEFASSNNLKSYGIWDYNDLRGFIDGDADVRAAYAHFITAGDVLSSVMLAINIKRPNFTDVMHNFLQKELIADASAKLQSAGEDPERQIPLANLFVDLPFADTAEKAVLVDEREDDKLPKVVAELLQAGARVLRKATNETDFAEKDRLLGLPPSRFVIVGGPGQGKSTFGQYLCQLYRAAILKDRPRHRLDERVAGILSQLDRQQADVGGLPVARRFPIRIELRNFSHALKVDDRLTLLEYIRRDIERLGNATILMEDFNAWLSNYPWVLVLDGLDEVPASSNRRAVLEEIGSLRVDVASNNGDVLFVATTRPQGYSSDFSEELFRHLYLTPLSPNQALIYGRKLAKAWCSSDERREDELIRSLEKACRNRTTARLMQSPLQVTIMATLLEDTGEPPQQRYRLFAEYYRTIYKRETRRKLLDGILSERLKDIDTIHQQVGLVLHARGESATEPHRRVRIDDVDSALSDEEFRSLVRHRLDQIGVTEPKASELLDTISAGSLQRLVFLVRPREGWVRFDITSFKEFMAAEALMNGSDSDVRQRLEAIAAVSYWRNVFQFAVGKCFVEKEHLLDTLVSLCVGLNAGTACADFVTDEIAGRAAAAVLWGSRLALDILIDGTARQYPEFEARFATIALQLLKGTDHQTCARIASVFHDDFKVLYYEALRECLKYGNSWARIGALRVLSDLADRDIEWSIRLLDEAWPDDISVQRAILLTGPIRVRSSWATKRVLDLAPQIEPYWLVRYGHARNNKAKESSIYPLLRAIGSVERNRRDYIAITNHSSWKDVIPEFIVTPYESNADLWETMSNFQFTDEAWFPTVAGARFAANPSATSLATELRVLAEHWAPNLYYWIPAIPWPLAACLASVNSKAGMIRMADRAAEGLLGDRGEWKVAENRWRDKGAVDQDFLGLPEEYPYSSRIKTVGLPFGGMETRMPRGLSHGELSKAIEDIRRLPDGNIRAWIATALFSSLLFVEPTRTPLDPDQTRALHDIMTAGSGANERFHIRIDEFLVRAALEGFSEKWIDFFDWVGRERIWISVESPKADAAQILIYRFSADPEKYRGLLRIIAAIAVAGCKCIVARHVLDVASGWGDEAKSDVIGLRLAGAGLEKSEITNLCKEILRSEPLAGASYRYLRMALASSQRQGVEVALNLVGFSDESSELMNDVTDNARRVLVEFLTKKPSCLGDPAVWNKLNLPFRP